MDTLESRGLTLSAVESQRQGSTVTSLALKDLSAGIWCVSSKEESLPALRFRVLAVVNGAAVSAGVCVSVWIVVFSGMCPVLGLLGHGTGLF